MWKDHEFQVRDHNAVVYAHISWIRSAESLYDHFTFLKGNGLCLSTYMCAYVHNDRYSEMVLLL